MRTPILVAVALTVAATFDARAGDARAGGTANVILPNPQLVGSRLDLVGCAKPDCLELWQKRPDLLEPVYPAQLRLDIARVTDAPKPRNCVRGLLAIYDEATTLAVVQAAVNEQYGKWAMAENATSRVKLWRVEPNGPNGLVVQLRASDEGLMLIYLPMGGPCR